LSAAIAALPANDSLRLEDVCGKRVSSCTLRFPEQSLPFGGFPGANVTRR
jgi:phage-related protein